MMSRLDWQRDGQDWPNRESSRFVSAAGFEWHVQQMGAGPPLLLLHGTGAATHSWRQLAPLLARHFTVIAPDLPGHGFSAMPAPAGMSLPGMAASVHELLQVLGVAPVMAVGHSAGAAIVARMALDHDTARHGIVSLNGALTPMRGVQGLVFPPVARVLARNTLIPHLFAWAGSDPASVQRMIRATGSSIDSEGMALYARLVGNPGHVAGALNMMANWDLWKFSRDLPRLKTPLTLVVGGNDLTIPPVNAAQVTALLPHARLHTLSGLGHLAHEEQPLQIAGLIAQVARDAGLLRN
jgi:magnesium chelatase accessory protein